MPLRTGNLRSLANAPGRRWASDELSLAVLEQMLSALDHLACKDMCHRDVKPENILYWEGTDGYTLQLADFGLSNHRHLAVTKCGTGYYEAPELHPEYGKFDQSPKMDVWSLFATVADINPRFAFPPVRARSYDDVLRAIRAVALVEPQLAVMVRENPNHRASAAQLLVTLFNGRGLSTPRAQVPPIPPAQPSAADASASVPASQAPPPKAPAKAPAARALGAFPLVKHIREPRRRLGQLPDAGKGPFPVLRPLGTGGITKPRVPAPPTRPGGRPARTPAAEQSPLDGVPAEKRGPKRDQEETTYQPGAGLLRIPGAFPA